jgi:hypothetical protein
MLCPPSLSTLTVVRALWEILSTSTVCCGTGTSTNACINESSNVHGVVMDGDADKYPEIFNVQELLSALPITSLKCLRLKVWTLTWRDWPDDWARHAKVHHI